MEIFNFNKLVCKIRFTNKYFKINEHNLICGEEQ